MGVPTAPRIRRNDRRRHSRWGVTLIEQHDVSLFVIIWKNLSTLLPLDSLTPERTCGALHSSMPLFFRKNKTPTNSPRHVDNDDEIHRVYEKKIRMDGPFALPNLSVLSLRHQSQCIHRFSTFLAVVVMVRMRECQRDLWSSRLKGS